MLKRMVKRANDLRYESFREEGLTPVMGAEIEFTVTPTTEAVEAMRVDPINPLDIELRSTEDYQRHVAKEEGITLRPNVVPPL